MPSTYDIINAYMNANAGAPPIISVNSGSLAIIDLAKSWYYSITLNAANPVIGPPINPPPRFTYITITLIQDATGSRSPTWAPCWRNPPNWSAGGAAGTQASGCFFFDGSSYVYSGGDSGFAGAASYISPTTGLLTVAGSTPAIPVAPPRPTVGAVALAGVAPTVTQRTSTVITPSAGGATLAGVLAINNTNIQVSNQGSFSLAVVGQQVTRTP